MHAHFKVHFWIHWYWQNMQYLLCYRNEGQARASRDRSRIEIFAIFIISQSTLSMQTGNAVASTQPNARAAVNEKLGSLDKEWAELTDTSADKGRRLQEAVQGERFYRTVDDLMDWVADVEGKLANDDVGKDVPSVQQLIKKQQVGQFLLNHLPSPLPLFLFISFSVLSSSEPKTFSLVNFHCPGMFPEILHKHVTSTSPFFSFLWFPEAEISVIVL